MSKTPFVNTIRRPRARWSLANAAASSRVIFGELHRGRKTPRVFGPIDADVLGSRLHAERVEQAVIVVRIPVTFVDGHVQLVGAFDEIETPNVEIDLAVAEDLDRAEFLDVRVRTVTADPLGVEDPDP